MQRVLSALAAGKTAAVRTREWLVDRLYATAQKGWFELRPSFNALGLQGNTSNGPITVKVPPFQQIAQMDDFADCILKNRKSIVSGEEALKDIKLLEIRGFTLLLHENI